MQSRKGNSQKMSQKVIIILCSLALAKGGNVGPEFSPATSLSYSSSSTPSTIKSETSKLSKVLKLPLDYTNIYAPSPLYESELATQERKPKTINGTENAIYLKSINTANSDIKKVESRYLKDGDFIHSNIPTVYSTAIYQEPVFYHPQNTNSVSTPISHEISNPIVTKFTYIPTLYDSHLTTTLDDNQGLATPGSKARSSIPNLSYYSKPSLVISEPVKTSIAYSDAPLVSHMTFNGLGASYGW